MRRPSFQFYPADWRKDVELQSCSMPAQGLWINVMCVAHECEPYGHLMLAGKPMQVAQLANLCRISVGKCKLFLQELESAGVFSRTENGAIFVRRMVRDEAAREAHAEVGRKNGERGKQYGEMGGSHGGKGGRPRTTDNPARTPPPIPPQEPPQNPHSSSSSSTSTSVYTPLPPQGEPGFDKFWDAWPRTSRKEAKGKCLQAWRKAKAESVADEVVAHVEMKKSSDDWLRHGGQYIEAPLVYLNQRRWEGVEIDGDLLSRGHANSV